MSKIIPLQRIIRLNRVAKEGLSEETIFMLRSNGWETSFMSQLMLKLKAYFFKLIWSKMLIMEHVVASLVFFGNIFV